MRWRSGSDAFGAHICRRRNERALVGRQFDPRVRTYTSASTGACANAYTDAGANASTVTNANANPDSVAYAAVTNPNAGEEHCEADG